jgi:pimeloyl-ACP methyl ester carboxylesterase
MTAASMPQMPGVRHEWAELNGVRTHYAEAGSGEPIVLMHGWPENWWSWRHVIGPLAERYRVICPDIRALGWSEAPDTGYTQWHQRDDLFALLDHLGLDRGVRLIGHDFGLITGYLACFEQPERFERFVPMGGIHPWTATGLTPMLLARPFHIYLLASRAGERLAGQTRFPRFLMDYWHGGGGFEAEVADSYTSLIQRPATARAAHQRYHHIVRHEIPWFARHHRDLRQRVPTLHLNGEHDPLTIGTPDSWRRFADDMTVELVPDCGHFIAEERPDWVLDRVLPFLE